MENLNKYKAFIEMILDKNISTGKTCVNETSESGGLSKVFKDFNIFIDKKGVLGDHLRYTTVSDLKVEKCRHISTSSFINEKAIFWAMSKGYCISYGLVSTGEWRTVIETIENDSSENIEFIYSDMYESIFEAFNYVFMIETVSLKDAVTLMEKLELEALEYGFSELNILPLEYYVELFTSGNINELKAILSNETDPIREEFLLWIFSKLDIKG